MPDWQNDSGRDDAFHLPAYSPHLNIIETLWRRIKYKWLKPGDYANMQTLKEAIDQILNSVGDTRHAVAEAFFSRKPFVDKMLEMGLHLVSRLRDDADLKYLSTGAPTGKRGRTRQYGEKADIKNLGPKRFIPLKNNRGINAWHGIVYCKSLKRNIMAVIEEFSIRNKTTRRILFSTDTGQFPGDVQDICHTRFQMEFGFRDAKQFTGMGYTQARSGNKLYFHFNTALTAVNIAKVMRWKDEKRRELPFSIRDCKTLFYNQSMLSRFCDKFGISPNSKKNQQIFKELLLFGSMAA